MKTRLVFHCMLLRSTNKLAACTMMLQAIINGTASVGGKTCSRIAPATAENANPAKPETTAPAKTAPLSTKYTAMSDMYRFLENGDCRQKPDSIGASECTHATTADPSSRPGSPLLPFRWVGCSAR